nr:Rv3654c family TadE-like protein [Actinomyces oris]
MRQPATRGAWGNRPGWDERGSGTVYALGVITVLLVAALGITGLIQAQSATGRARAAADLAAISGATVLSSVIAPGDPCAMAGRVAAANGASVSSCSVTGEDVTVSVVVPTTILGRPRQATAQARAGPVDAPPKP